MYWFAAARKEPYLLWSEWQKLEGPPEEALRGFHDAADRYALAVGWQPVLRCVGLDRARAAGLA